MIVVKIKRDKLTVRGHAGYAEYGKDIVCAAISALTIGLLFCMRIELVQ